MAVAVQKPCGYHPAKRQMPLRPSILTVVLLLVVPAAAAWLAWGFYDRAAGRVGQSGCDGEAVGTIRISDNGSPQICLPR